VAAFPRIKGGPGTRWIAGGRGVLGADLNTVAKFIKPTPLLYSKFICTLVTYNWVLPSEYIILVKFFMLYSGNRLKFLMKHIIYVVIFVFISDVHT
jgi:hypothetical protein